MGKNQYQILEILLRSPQRASQIRQQMYDAPSYRSLRNSLDRMASHHLVSLDRRVWSLTAQGQSLALQLYGNCPANSLPCITLTQSRKLCLERLYRASRPLYVRDFPLTPYGVIQQMKRLRALHLVSSPTKGQYTLTTLGIQYAQLLDSTKAIGTLEAARVTSKCT